MKKPTSVTWSDRDWCYYGRCPDCDELLTFHEAWQPNEFDEEIKCERCGTILDVKLNRRLNMKSETIIELVRELVGYIEPCGNAGLDKTRYMNQEKIIDLVTNGIEDLIRNSRYKGRREYSIGMIGDRAYEVLEELYKLIKNNIE